MSFYLFRRYFLSSRSSSLIRLISWLCLAGVAVSIVALLLIVSVMEGLGQAVKDRLLSKQAHLRIQYDKNPFFDIRPSLDNLLFESKALPGFLAQSLSAEQKQGIQSVKTFETQELILKSPKGFKGVSAKGYQKSTWDHLEESAGMEENFNPVRPVLPDNSLQAPPLEQNPQLNPNSPQASLLEQNLQLSQPDSLQAPLLQQHGMLNPLVKEVWISYSLSLETGLSSGDEVMFVPIMGLLLPAGVPPPVKVFKVKGVLNKDSATSIYYQQGDMDFGSFSKLEYQSEIQLHQPDKALEYQSLFKDYKIKTWMQENSNLFFALKLEKFIMTLFFVISLVISCLGISSALLLLMTQKAEDIAILQAMGMSKKEIVKSFTKIGLHLSSLALLIGGVFGLSVVLLLKFNRINILPAIYQDRTIPAHFLPIDYAFIFLGAGLVAYMFCYLPTHYFSRMNLVSLLKRTHF